MNRIKKLIKLFLLFVFVVAGCEDDVVISEMDENLVVVQGFVYANQPVKDFFISGVLPLGSNDTVAPPITNAIVSIEKEGEKYQLAPDSDKPGFYYYPNSDLTIISGDEIFLEVNVNNKNLFAKTTVPVKPENLSLDSQTLTIPVFIPGSGRRPPELDSFSIKLSWDNFDDSYYYVTIENIEENPEPVEMSRGKFSSRFISEPSISSEYRVSFRLITHLGLHQLILYKVNQEYVDLYESRNQDSRNLNEPLSNIENGLGIFSAFASDTVYFNVVKE